MCQAIWAWLPHRCLVGRLWLSRKLYRERARERMGYDVLGAVVINMSLLALR